MLLSCISRVLAPRISSARPPAQAGVLIAVVRGDGAAPRPRLRPRLFAAAGARPDLPAGKDSCTQRAVSMSVSRPAAAAEAAGGGSRPLAAAESPDASCTMLPPRRREAAPLSVPGVGGSRPLGARCMSADMPRAPPPGSRPDASRRMSAGLGSSTGRDAGSDCGRGTEPCRPAADDAPPPPRLPAELGRTSASHAARLRAPGLPPSGCCCWLGCAASTAALCWGAARPLCCCRVGSW